MGDAHALYGLRRECTALSARCNPMTAGYAFATRRAAGLGTVPVGLFLIGAVARARGLLTD